MVVGWIKLYRKFLEWEWYTDSKMVHLFIHLLLSASIEERKWKGIVLERGQLATTLPELSKKTGISIKSIRTALEKMENGQIIGRQPTNKYTLITICNFESYQAKEEGEGQTTGRQTADQGQTNGNQRAGTIAEERKNVRKREDSSTTTTTTVCISQNTGASAGAREKMSFYDLPKEQQEAERWAFFETFFWADALRPWEEVKKFIRKNQGLGWRAKDSGTVFDTPAQRLALAEMWAGDDKCPKDRDRYLNIQRSIYDGVRAARPDLARLCLDLRNGVQPLDGPCIVVLHYVADQLCDFLKNDAQGQAIARRAINPKWKVEISNTPIYR